MKKLVISVVLCAALVFSLTACSGKKDAAKKTVAVLIPGPAGYFNATKEGVDRAAKEFGINVVYADAGWDAAKQMSQIEDFIQRKVDLIAVCCVDAKAIESAIPKIREAGVPIIAFTNGIGTAPTGEYPGLVTYVGQNEIDTGEIVGDYAKKLLGSEGGKVIMIEGVPGTTPQINRRAGFLRAIGTQPNIEVIFTGSSEWDKEKAIKITEDLIQSKRQFDLVFAQDAGSGAGAAMALIEAGLRDKVYVLAIDGSKEAMQSVKDGLINSTTWMSAKEEGYRTIEVASRYFKGENLPTVTQLKQILITQDNCNDYEGEF
ncbi:MAG: sugar ABC transporter substrate-binding protein [Spirochaetaceae bacterium]|jgi:ribose transport system substrate-binding protein|nr:sugar ABC transporter substrate-binding protein [Spirochaetaceae bacterium]